MELMTSILDDDGAIPNSLLPVMIYRQVYSGTDSKNPAVYEALFDENRWGGAWRNGLYSFHHYHSTAHEVLGIYSGWADVQLGGASGGSFHVETGDILVLPAGTGHKCLDHSNLGIVGSYPNGQYPDMQYGKPGERPNVDVLIAQVPKPDVDPVLGLYGGIIEYWRS